MSVNTGKPTRCRHSLGEWDAGVSNQERATHSVRGASREPASSKEVPSGSRRSTDFASRGPPMEDKRSSNEASIVRNGSLGDGAVTDRSSTEAYSSSTDNDYLESSSTSLGEGIGLEDTSSSRWAPSHSDGSRLSADGDNNVGQSPDEATHVSPDRPPGEDTESTAVFGFFLRAIRAETRRLEDAGSLAVTFPESQSHLSVVLEDLVATLRNSEDQSLRLSEGIASIREAARRLKETLDDRPKHSLHTEEWPIPSKDINDIQEAPSPFSSSANVTVAERKIALASVAHDVASAVEMAAEAESAAAEAAQAAEEVAEEIEGMGGKLEQEDGDGNADTNDQTEIDEAIDPGEEDEERSGDGYHGDGNHVDGGDNDGNSSDDGGEGGGGDAATDDDTDDDQHQHNGGNEEEIEDTSSSRLSRPSAGQDKDSPQSDDDDGDKAEDNLSEDEDEEKSEQDEAVGQDEEDTSKSDAGETDDDSPTSNRSLSSRRSIRENMTEWPYQVLSLPDDDVTDDEIGCVVRFKREYFTTSVPEFRCVLDNRISVGAVSGDSEELVSHVVNVVNDAEALEGALLEVPIVVALPYSVSARMMSTRELVVKSKGGGDTGEWKVVPTLAVDSSFAEHKGSFIEARTDHVGSFAVVARLSKDRQTITKRGGVIKSSSDHRMCISYPPGICTLMSVTLQVQPAEHTVSELKSRMRHCSDLIAASPIIHLSHSTDKRFDKPVTVTIPCPPNPLRATAASASDAAAPVANKTTASERQAPLSPNGAVVIRGTKSSIFGGDPAEDALHLMHRQSNWTYWNEMEKAQIKQVRKDLVSVEIEKPIDKLLVFRMTADARYPPKNVAQTFERALQIKYATILLQHREDDPQRVVAQCVATRQLDAALRRLGQEGYEGPPDPSGNIAMTEGQEVTLRFTGNIRIVGQDSVSLIFHSHRRNIVEFTIEETNKFGNHSSEEYRGVAEFYGRPRLVLADMEDPEEVLLREAEAKAAAKGAKHSGSSTMSKPDKKKPSAEGVDGAGRDYQSLRKTDPDLLCKLSVSLPKVEAEPPPPPSRYRATAIDIKGAVSNANLRWLSAELGNEWESLATALGIKRSRLQSIKRNNPGKLDQQVLDMLVTWRSLLPRAYDKERKLCRALVRCGRYDLAEELKEKDVANGDDMMNVNNNINVLDVDDY